jgi:prepilin-type N-terminal cleavage/methylation domain-containing protein
MNLSRRTGFTLIEILVVVSIIAILSTVLFGSFTGSLGNADNKAAQSKLKETQLAIELYEAQKGTYPLPNTAGACGSTSGTVLRSSDSDCPGNYILGLTPDYISSLPTITLSANTACDIEYQTDPAGTWYKLTAINCLDDSAVMSASDPLARCPLSCGGSGICSPTDPSAYFTSSFAVYSRGGACQ